MILPPEGPPLGLGGMWARGFAARGIICCHLPSIMLMQPFHSSTKCSDARGFLQHAASTTSGVRVDRRRTSIQHVSHENLYVRRLMLSKVMIAEKISSKVYHVSRSSRTAQCREDHVISHADLCRALMRSAVGAIKPAYGSALLSLSAGRSPSRSNK